MRLPGTGAQNGGIVLVSTAKNPQETKDTKAIRACSAGWQCRKPKFKAQIQSSKKAPQANLQTNRLWTRAWNLAIGAWNFF
jgi:hypothetical protein